MKIQIQFKLNNLAVKGLMSLPGVLVAQGANEQSNDRTNERTIEQ